MNNFILRSISALCLIPLMLGFIYVGDIWFTTLVFIASVIMAYEWQDISTRREDVNHKFWYLLGIFYITIPCVSLIWLRAQAQGFIIVLWIFSVVWATDIGAYLAGRSIGGWKLAPKISPNKTWAGLIGGAICAGLVGYCFGYLNQVSSYYVIVNLSIILAIYAQIGDLLESWIKRYFNVKDSGNLIPGHGGLLDRIDGLILTLPKVVLVVLIERGNLF